MKCMDGICAANFKNCKNITRRDPDHEATKMCSHLRTLFSHFGCVKGFFSDYFTDSIDEIEEEQFIGGAPDSDAVNNEDANLPRSLTGHFDVASRLWKYPALSSHKPKEMQDPHIVNCTQKCDGTYIGVSVRNMKLDKPVTMPVIKDGALKPMHKKW